MNLFGVSLELEGSKIGLKNTFLLSIGIVLPPLNFFLVRWEKGKKTKIRSLERTHLRHHPLKQKINKREAHTT